MRKRAGLLGSYLLLCATSAALFSSGASADLRPDIDIDADIRRDTTLEVSRDTSTDITKSTSIDVSKEVSVTSARQDLSAELSELSIVVAAETDALAVDGLGSTTQTATLRSGAVNVSTGDNFGGIANFNTSAGQHNAAVGGVAVAANANINFGR